jgi:hypothetical protein
MLNFSTSSKTIIDIVITCDPSLDMTDEEKLFYLKGQRSLLKIKQDQKPTIFKIHALSPSQREEAEIKAGAYTRSELGRFLFLEQPNELREKAYWHEALNEREKKALSEYNAYLNRVYQEMVKASLIEIEGLDGDPWILIQSIKPDSIRLQTVSELITHITSLSLLGDLGK